MTKPKFAVRCQACGYLAPKWMGRCPGCGSWSTMTEEPLDSDSSTKRRWKASTAQAEPISSVSTTESDRWPTGLEELDIVLGGGIVPGSIVLLGGEPGIGKSTLLLQMAHSVADKAGPVLLVSGEESAKQIKLRADRLGTISDNLYLLPEIDLSEIERHVEELSPRLVIIDSIQTVFHPDVPSAPGSVSQVRECTSHLTRLAKLKLVPVFIIGHVTKEGAIAGPRVLEHIVDTVLYFEGENESSYRIVRSVKNRYGSTNEIGVFEMTGQGLIEVANASALFLSEKSADSAGAVVLATIEGTRPLLVELQALVTPSYSAAPRRMTSGLDYNRLCLTAAVLDRKAGLNLGQQDIYVNVVGGVKVVEPGVDLAMALAVFSAHRDLLVPRDVVVVGEVGLTGEVRPVAQLERRLKEAARLGFKSAVVPKQNVESVGESPLELHSVSTIHQALDVYS